MREDYEQKTDGAEDCISELALRSLRKRRVAPNSSMTAGMSAISDLSNVALIVGTAARLLGKRCRATMRNEPALQKPSAVSCNGSALTPGHRSLLSRPHNKRRTWTRQPVVGRSEPRPA